MIRLLVNTGACFALVGLVQTAMADSAIIIGGGNNLTASQGQIELNVQYAKETLKAKGLNVSTYYTDGDDPGNDVFIQHQEPLNAEYDGLSRVFGNHLEQNREYRSNNLTDLSGSTQRDLLLPNLRAELKEATDPLWLIYNGHGQQSQSTPDQVTLELWNDTQLTANELHQELKATKQSVRYAFTQCYSGGFHSIAYEKPNNSLKPAKPLRCGFTAVSAYSLAEGCSASINTDDYRDYTTHFFAALTGYERNGSVVNQDPDADQNGDVSPREAHFYTLQNANSTDLSWSTSEDFLTRWEPWYLKWTPRVKDLPNNEYAKLFRSLAQDANISLDQNSVGVIRDELSELHNKRHSLAQKMIQNRQTIQKLRQDIAKPITAQWPAIIAPYTTGFQQLNKKGGLKNINAAIEADAQYANLLEAQVATVDLENKTLNLERDITQLEKLLHLRRIATLKDQLMTFGSKTDINTYNEFMACEEMAIVGSSEKIPLATAPE